ncbi:MAG: molybdenum cofactor biosynthesis protein [Thermoplasmata archaeon]|nr:MAG: molybdenum cofactor biosynthesis protein [Thermoplasmata archaeon]
MSLEEHRKHAVREIKFSLVITTDSRDENSDISGRMMKDMIEDRGYTILSTYFIKNDFDEIQRILQDLIREKADIIIFSGGTGISSRDVTVDAIKPLFDKELYGFGELFRYLSMKEIGSSALLSRACAGVKDNSIIFCIPGSPNAVKLAMEELILKEAGHLLYEARK